jgi:multisubunit Na+/H+ antiporter MnhB subunit
MDNPNTQIHDHSLSWLDTDTLIKNRHRYNMDNPSICVLGLSMLYLCLLFIQVSVSSQESEWSFICVLGLSMLYLCLLFIEVTVPSQESEWSCIWYNMDNPNTQIHDHSLSWLDTDTLIKSRHRYNMDNPNTQINVSVSSQESQRSCICVLGLSMLYLCLLFIKVTVPSQESEWSCICVLGLSMLYLRLFLLKCLYQIDTYTTWITLTHKYTTTHFPGLVQAW